MVPHWEVAVLGRAQVSCSTSPTATRRHCQLTKHRAQSAALGLLSVWVWLGLSHFYLCNIGQMA